MRVVFDQGAIALLARDDVNVIAAMEYLSGKVLREMKACCLVSPVHPVYARKGATVAAGKRLAGDFPLRPSGYLRSSCHRLREPDGGYIIGPTANYALYVNNGTEPHVIMSHGLWPLRNRATGQVFGRVVHHPGAQAQPFIIESLQAIAGAVADVTVSAEKAVCAWVNQTSGLAGQSGPLPQGAFTIMQRSTAGAGAYALVIRQQGPVQRTTDMGAPSPAPARPARYAATYPPPAGTASASSKPRSGSPDTGPGHPRSLIAVA